MSSASSASPEVADRQRHHSYGQQRAKPEEDVAMIAIVPESLAVQTIVLEKIKQGKE
jgi:hypothetical protein